MTIHHVKSWTPFFEAFMRGDKRHDLRDDDRNYQIGDVLVLQEFHPFGNGYSGREMSMEVSYITGRETPCAFSSSALAKGFVILSLRPVELPDEQ
jgi:hypothetical protein